jgi:gamma-glutamylcyclotransferase (GGCT)/AIG2-like uncharacterized protein YtfP
VFVYGTLRAGESNASLLDGVVVERRPATLPGHRLHLLEYPCVVEHTHGSPTPVPQGPVPWVRGELVIVEDGSYDAALERLDWLEGFDRADVAASLYVRVAATAETPAGAVECWVYLAGATLRPRLDPTNLIASGDWLDR